MIRNFCLSDLISVARRENNQKRNYLYVNPCQGKHIPVSPSIALNLFSKLAEIVEKTYRSETLLVIGFAETATAIGAAIATNASNVDYYLSTTRENVDGAEFLYFTESHSHATEQRLVANHLEECLAKVDRILFAEDEVTTGSTIEKLIDVLKEKYAGSAKAFGIISILNSMSDERRFDLEAKGVGVDFLFRIPPLYRTQEIENYHYTQLENATYAATDTVYNELRLPDSWNARVVEKTTVVEQKCRQFIAQTLSHVEIDCRTTRLLVLGTEEFMYPAMQLGRAIEEQYPTIEVSFHATTRSPIEISEDSSYPLHNRFSLDSLYEKGRKTFLYNLRPYQQVIIATDAMMFNKSGLENLVGALETNNCMRISIVVWEQGGNAE